MNLNRLKKIIKPRIFIGLSLLLAAGFILAAVNFLAIGNFVKAATKYACSSSVKYYLGFCKDALINNVPSDIYCGVSFPKKESIDVKAPGTDYFFRINSDGDVIFLLSTLEIFNSSNTSINDAKSEIVIGHGGGETLIASYKINVPGTIYPNKGATFDSMLADKKYTDNKNKFFVIKNKNGMAAAIFDSASLFDGDGKGDLYAGKLFLMDSMIINGNTAVSQVLKPLMNDSVNVDQPITSTFSLSENFNKQDFPYICRQWPDGQPNPETVLTLFKGCYSAVARYFPLPNDYSDDQCDQCQPTSVANITANMTGMVPLAKDTVCNRWCKDNSACNAAGKCADGSNCQAGGQCDGAGNCKGECLNDADTGICQRCNDGGAGENNNHTKYYIAAGTDPDGDCSAGSACDGAGNCKLADGQTCTADSACLSGDCNRQPGGAWVCTAALKECADQAGAGVDTNYSTCYNSDDYTCSAEGVYDTVSGWSASDCGDGTCGYYDDITACADGACSNCPTFCTADAQCDNGAHCDGECVADAAVLEVCDEPSDCASGYCRTDYDGVGSFCAASATDCVYDANGSGDAENSLANGYKQCSGDGYKTCSNGAWTSATDCITVYQTGGDPNYCQKDDRGCSSGLSGGCANDGWTNINQGSLCSGANFCSGDGWYDGKTCNNGACDTNYSYTVCNNADCKADGDGTYSARLDNTCSGGACTANAYVDCNTGYACNGAVCATACLNNDNNYCAGGYYCYDVNDICQAGTAGAKCDDVDADCDAGNLCRASNDTCVDGAVDSACDDDADCDAGNHCRASTQTCVSGGKGTACDDTGDCDNGTCLNNVCTGNSEVVDGGACNSSVQCSSGNCCSNKCVNVSSDTNNCGACGTVCSNSNGTTSCVSGVCTPVCIAGFGNCVNNNDGCEVDLNNDINNCGACGNLAYNSCGSYADVNACNNGTPQVCSNTCTPYDTGCDAGSAACVLDSATNQYVCKPLADAPKISGFSASPSVSTGGFTISWTIDGPEKNKLGHFELWRKSGSNWAMVIDNISKNDTSAVDTPPAIGEYQYGLHLVNSAGTAYGTETTSGFAPLTVTKVECTQTSQCEDNNPCTTDSCVSNACVHAGCPSGQTCCQSGGANCTSLNTPVYSYRYDKWYNYYSSPYYSAKCQSCDQNANSMDCSTPFFSSTDYGSGCYDKGGSSYNLFQKIGTQTSFTPGYGCCTPKTCAQIGFNCGSWDDGCGGAINCGSCSAGNQCSFGACKKIAGQACSAASQCLSNYCSNGYCCSGGKCCAATADCNDSNDCTAESCNSSNQCAYSNNANSSVCSGGYCYGGVCDTAKPTGAIAVSSNNIVSNQSVTITVSNIADFGSGMARVEIWRRINGGAWSQIFSQDPYVSGNVSTTENPLGSAGTVYEYGFHLVDRAGNTGTESVPATVTIRRCTVDTALTICNDNNSCTTDSCTDYACVNANNTSACDDGNDCTASDACSSGACGGTALNCVSSANCPACASGTKYCASGVCTAKLTSGASCVADGQCASGLVCGQVLKTTYTYNFWRTQSYAYGSKCSCDTNNSTADCAKPFSANSDSGSYCYDRLGSYYNIFYRAGVQQGYVNECKTPSTWYRDADADNYGNAAVLTQAGSKPAGYVANSTDCDDSNSAVKPGAAEICNGIDDNCVNGIDEGVKITYYQDADVDTYGNASVISQACSQPAGYVTNNTDCNDGNFAVKPGAAESCNGFDDNCNGVTDEGCPINITNCTDLQKIGNDAAYPLNGSYELANDIDCSDTINWNMISGIKRGFKPIGGSTPFTGKFNGNYKVIKNLYIYYPAYPGENYGSAGLFGAVSAAEIKNVGLTNVTVVSQGYAGGLASGISNSTNVSNSYAIGYVYGESGAGGLIAVSYSSNINNSYSSGSVYGGTAFAGGLIADINEGSKIYNSYSASNVSGNSYKGGLVGAMSGFGSLSYIYNSYSIGSVSGSSYSIGGLVGGFGGGYINNSYWNTQTSGQTAGCGINSCSGASGKTTMQMIDSSQYSNWNFSGTWKMYSTYGVFTQCYPLLYWQPGFCIPSGIEFEPSRAGYGDEPHPGGLEYNLHAEASTALARCTLSSGGAYGGPYTKLIAWQAETSPTTDYVSTYLGGWWHTTRAAGYYKIKWIQCGN